MPGRTMSAPQREAFIHSMQDQGVKVTRTKKGLLLRLPDGSSTAVHFTNSDIRAEKNLMARLRRSGVNHPDDTKADILPKGITGYPASKQTMAKIKGMVIDLGYPTSVTVQEVIENCGVEHITASRGLYTMGFVPVMGKRNKRSWLTPQEILSEKPEPEPESPTIPTPKDVLTAAVENTIDATDDYDLDERPTITIDPDEDIRDTMPDPIDEAMNPTRDETEVQRLKDMPGAEKREPVVGDEPEPTAMSDSDTATGAHIDFIDERDSWVVDLEELVGPSYVYIKDKLAVLGVLGMEYEFRVWRKN